VGLFDSIGQFGSQPMPGFVPQPSGTTLGGKPLPLMHDMVNPTTPAPVVFGAGHDPYTGSRGVQFDPNGLGYHAIRMMAEAAHGQLPANWYPGYYRDLAAQGAGTPPATTPPPAVAPPPATTPAPTTPPTQPPIGSTPPATQGGGNIMQSIMQAFGNGGGTAAPGQGFDVSRLMNLVGRGG
jgi:hypothetical protein